MKIHLRAQLTLGKYLIFYEMRFIDPWLVRHSFLVPTDLEPMVHTDGSLNILLKSKTSFSSSVVSALYSSAFRYSNDVPVAGHFIKKEVYLAQFQRLKVQMWPKLHQSHHVKNTCVLLYVASCLLFLNSP